MTDDDYQLVRDVTLALGTTAPDWANDDAPLLQNDDRSVYLIGLIGGKDVGKSSLINALLGQPIAHVSAYGEGTARALAYVHVDDAEAVRQLLTQATDQPFDLVTHRADAARGRVLLDLPDIDSVWPGHLELTRDLLKHMLFPVWVQSVEKYADSQPLQLLTKVSAGNAVDNFVFVITKADQLARRHGETAVAELSADYAQRVARASATTTPPRVFSVNNLEAGAFDLPALQSVVLGNRSPAQIETARLRARTQQRNTLGAWLREQRIEQRTQAVKRSLDDAEALLNARLTQPLVDQISHRLTTDTAVRSGVIEPAVRRRLSYWPVVNVIDATLAPVLTALRARGDVANVEAINGRDVASHLRGVFAELSQRDTTILSLYDRQKLWDSSAADVQASTLAARIDAAQQQQRAALAKTLGRPSLIERLAAPVLTIGVALWFPIIQPVASVLLQRDVTVITRETVLLLVNVLGANYLIQSIGLLAIYFVALWMFLRWRAGRRIDKALQRAATTDHPGSVVLQWTQTLLAPLRGEVAKLDALSQRVAAHTASISVSH